jgi:hypothetical protein
VSLPPDEEDEHYDMVKQEVDEAMEDTAHRAQAICPRSTRQS